MFSRTVKKANIVQRTAPCMKATRNVAVAASAVDKRKATSNGGGPHRLSDVQTTLDDITSALAACIKEAGHMSALERLNRGIAKEISKAAMKRSRK